MKRVDVSMLRSQSLPHVDLQVFTDTQTDIYVDQLEIKIDRQKQQTCKQTKKTNTDRQTK